MRKAIIFIAVAFLLVFWAAPVYANDILPLPHAFCGTVKINDNPAPENTTVEARGKGVTTGAEGNPITVTEEGKFGSPEPLGQKLIVKGDIADGTEISFLVNGTYTGTTFDFKQGETTVLDLNLVTTATSITGKVKEIVPSNQTGYVVDATDIANTTITVSTTGVVTITVKKYYSNPHPEAALPATMLPRYIDIEVDNLGAIDWPMHVEQTYTDAEVAGLDESSLGMYYFKAPAWHRCKDTGVNTGANYIWADMWDYELSGSPVAIGGTAAPAPPPPTGWGGGEPAVGPPLPPGTTDVSRFIDAYGIFTASVIAESEDGVCRLIIDAGRKGTKDDKPLSEITIVPVEDPPEPPKDNYIVLAYDLGPNGAIFEPAITLEFTVDPADIPEGLDVVPAYYDVETGAWVELADFTITNSTVTASVSHFTTFAIIAVPPPPVPAKFTSSSLAISPAKVAPGEKVNIGVSVANTGGTEGRYTVVLKINGVKEADKSITVAAGRKQTVTFSITRKEAGKYTIAVDGLSGSFTVLAPVVVAPPPKPPAPPPAPPAPPPAPPAPPPAPLITWPVLGGILAATVVLIVVVVLLATRRRRY